MASSDEHVPDTVDQNVQTPPQKEKKAVQRGLFGYIAFALILSIATNVLLLVSPLYMIQVYDRVLTSGSYSTLLSLSIIAVFLLSIFAFAEAGRRRALSMYARHMMDSHFERLGRWFLSKEKNNKSDPNADLPSFQDVSRVHSSLNGGMILPFFDLPFAPFFLGLLFLLHPIIGFIGVGGAVILILIAILNEMATSKRHNEDQKAEMAAQSFISEVGRSSNAVIAMGMRTRLLDRWQGLKEKASTSNLKTSSVASLLTGISKSARQILQAVVLGAGAFLTLQQEMSPGAIVAGSIIMGRGLAPIDQIVGSWKQLALVSKSWSKLRSFTKIAETKDQKTEEFAVGSISAGLVCRNLAVNPPNAEKPVVENMNLAVGFGEVVAIVGASGSGKSTLLQTIAGIWPTASGDITLGNRSVLEWEDEDRGRFIGYLPQRIELVPGTVADNISRFQPERYDEIEGIAELLGYKDLFMSLPQAYTTMIGEHGQQLSAGQRQAIGLARACFGETRLLLLDEPTANLDVNLTRSFITSLEALKQRNMAVVLTTHDSRILPAIDRLFSIQNGQLVKLDNPAKGQKLQTVTAKSSGNAS